MDSKTLLDYALFHLTPTRTRCDLVVFSGGKSEKLASGLVEPFVSHLKFAKDQILKGGYSITLRPPTADAFWFTKHTFQRFVRFVSTPEILERFIQIEWEILQIASSIQSNEISSSNNEGHEEEGCSLAVDGVTKKTTNSYKSKSKVGVDDGAAPEENSKCRLQRLLGTRKSLLLKEQAMAYARAKAAGFEMDCMDDLIYFADLFGASRLREACADFRDLYKQKHTDVQWMYELAAMEACPPNELSYLGTSGITLAFENNGSSQSNGPDFQNSSSSSNLDANGTDLDIIADKDLSKSHQTPPTTAKIQLNMPWPNQGPQYLHNFQIPMQQFPPYQGYPIPGMHPVPPYYPGHVQWPKPVDGPTNGLARETTNHRSHKSSKKKDKYSNVKGPETSEDDEQSESSISNSGTDTDEGRKHGKKHSPSEKPYVRKNRKSSKTVVIRNINYITSKVRNGDKDSVSDGYSSEEAAILYEDAIKKDVVDAVASLEKHHQSKEHKNKKGGNKGSSIQNGHNDYADHELIKDLSEEGQRNENWNAFQNLLMTHEESSPKAVPEKHTLDFEDQVAVKNSHDDISFTSGPTVNLESEKVKVKRLTTDVSVVLTERDGCDEGRINMVDIGNIEEIHPSTKRRDSEDVQLLFPPKLEGSGSSSLGMISDFSTESSIISSGNREDWFVVNRSADLEIQESKQTIFYESNTLSSEQDRFHMEASKNTSSIDDSLMVQSRPAIEDQHDLEWRTDISIVADLSMASRPVNDGSKVSHAKLGECGTPEPDDLCVVLVRDSMVQSSDSLTREMDYGIEMAFTEADRGSSAVETNGHNEETLDVDCKSTNGKKAVGPAIKSSGKETRSKLLQGTLSKSKADNSLKSKKPFSTSRSVVQKSKLETEEENRKRMEELVLQRQKRIAERTAASGLTSAASKMVITGSKTASMKLEKHRTQSVPKTVTMNSAKDAKKTNLRVASLVNA